jgi:hypothetical protein
MWTKPEDNWSSINKYSIYMKVIHEDCREYSWAQIGIVNETNSVPKFKYKVDSLKPRKKYNFIVTAWNEYGESFKDERKAKTIVISDCKCSYVKTTSSTGMSN